MNSSLNYPDHSLWVFTEHSAAAAMETGVTVRKRQIIPGDRNEGKILLTTLGIPALLGGRQACAGRTSSQQGTKEVPLQDKDKVNLTSIIIPTLLLISFGSQENLMENGRQRWSSPFHGWEN